MFKENLDVFFNPDEFGSEAVFELPDGTTFKFTVIFDDAFMNPETGLLSLETTEPVATCKTSDVQRLIDRISIINNETAILPGQTVPLRTLPATLEAAPGKRFSILQVRPEGTGTSAIVFAHDFVPAVAAKDSAFSPGFNSGFGRENTAGFNPGFNDGFGGT